MPLQAIFSGDPLRWHRERDISDISQKLAEKRELQRLMPAQVQAKPAFKQPRTGVSPVQRVCGNRLAAKMNWRTPRCTTLPPQARARRPHEQERSPRERFGAKSGHSFTLTSYKMDFL
jgi:hypothetical protein